MLLPKESCLHFKMSLQSPVGMHFQSWLNVVVLNGRVFLFFFFFQSAGVMIIANRCELTADSVDKLTFLAANAIF